MREMSRRTGSSRDQPMTKSRTDSTISCPGIRVLAFENTKVAVAPRAAHQAIVHHGDLDPDAVIADLLETQ